MFKKLFKSNRNEIRIKVLNNLPNVYLIQTFLFLVLILMLSIGCIVLSKQVASDRVLLYKLALDVIELKNKPLK